MKMKNASYEKFKDALGNISVYNENALAVDSK